MAHRVSANDTDDFLDELDAAHEHVTDALRWIAEHGEIDAGDTALLEQARDLLTLAMLNGDDPARRGAGEVP